VLRPVRATFCLIRCGVDEIVNADATGNRRVSYEQVDLGDWKSVRSLTQRVCSSHTRLDVLINNAGIMYSSFSAVCIRTRPSRLLIIGVRHFLTEISRNAVEYRTIKGKGKGFPYSLPSVGRGDDPGIQAVSPQVSINHPPGGRLPLLSAELPSQPQSITAGPGRIWERSAQ